MEQIWGTEQVHKCRIGYIRFENRGMSLEYNECKRSMLGEKNRRFRAMNHPWLIQEEAEGRGTMRDQLVCPVRKSNSKGATWLCSVECRIKFMSSFFSFFFSFLSFFLSFSFCFSFPFLSSFLPSFTFFFVFLFVSFSLPPFLSLSPLPLPLVLGIMPKTH